MSEIYSEKAAIFIDGGYLNKIIKKHFKETSLDYFKLSNKICSDLRLNRLRTYFYHCLPIVRGNNPQDIIKQASFNVFRYYKYVL